MPEYFSMVQDNRKCEVDVKTFGVNAAVIV